MRVLMLQFLKGSWHYGELDAVQAFGDKFVMKHVPFALDLEEELAGQTRRRRRREAAESSTTSEGESASDEGDSIAVAEPRELSEEEALTVRKILACVARMNGRFGKGMLAACLRGSRSSKLAQAGLDRLSTYGILSGMTQDEILIYVDALVAAGCLHVNVGAYPTVAITQLGSEVMRERAGIRLALRSSLYDSSPLKSSTPRASSLASPRSTVSPARSATSKPSTIDETYALYEQGLTIEEICARRGLTEFTVEKHLADCILEGRAFDIKTHVSDADRVLIESAVARLGTERLKPLRDALPRHFNYRMIRFVVADLQRAACLGPSHDD